MIKTALAFLLFTLPLPIVNATPIKGTVSFHAEATPNFLEIDSSGIVEGELVKEGSFVSGTFRVKLDQFKTGMSQRDKHMREKYLQTSIYPEAVFTLDKMLGAAGTRKGFTGILDLHGVKKKIEGTVVFDASKAETEFSIDITKYGIAVPEYSGLTVGKNVTIKVQIPL